MITYYTGTFTTWIGYNDYGCDYSYDYYYPTY